jgi:prevent-host-death family protein
MTSTEIGAAEFKARCLELMDRVARTKRPLTITKRGRPVVQVVPATPQPKKLFGAMKGAVLEAVDIVSPTGEVWEAER